MKSSFNSFEKKGDSLLKTKLWQFWHYFIKKSCPRRIFFANFTIIFWSPLFSDHFFQLFCFCILMASFAFQTWSSRCLFSQWVLLWPKTHTAVLTDGWRRWGMFLWKKNQVLLWTFLPFQYFRRTDLGAVASCLVLTRWLPDQLQILSVPGTLDHGLLSLTTLVRAGPLFQIFSSLKDLDHPSKSWSSLF